METSLSSFKFNDETHQFFLDDKEIPSVTTILKDFNLIKDGFYGEEFKWRGKFVHSACQYLDEDNLDWKTVEIPLIGYVKAYDKFRQSLTEKPLKIEQPLYSEIHKFAGIIDREYTWGVVEIKTGAYAKWHRLQTAAYSYLLNHDDQFPRYGLYLEADQSYKLKSFNVDDHCDLDVFLGLVKAYWWKNPRKIRAEEEE